MSPQNDDQPTEALLDRMNTDAVTFGGRIVPTEIDDYPDPVAEAIADRQAYDYTVQMHWQGVDLGDADTVVQAEDTEYGIIDAGDNSVVVSQSDHGADPFHSLTRVASERDTKALIGLPVPQMRTSGETWLPDHSYADVVDGFAENRSETSRERVEAQLDATDPYVQGAIGFQRSGLNAMTEIPHIGYGACAAGPDALQ